MMAILALWEVRICEGIGEIIGGPHLWRARWGYGRFVDFHLYIKRKFTY